MQAKIYNAYRITHKNGNVEDVNALDVVQALENMEIPETESKVLQLFLVKENVRTLVEDAATEIMFSAVVSEGSGGSIATPAAGKIHTGDEIALKAIPARNYAFVDWKLNGETISTEASLVFTIPSMGSLDTAVFTATFKLAPVAWETKVLPEDAGTAGSISFPTSGVTEANGSAEFLAVPAAGYTFDHWERNGVTLSTNKLLQTTVTPLADTEDTAVYTAVFFNS